MFWEAVDSIMPVRWWMHPEAAERKCASFALLLPFHYAHIFSVRHRTADERHLARFIKLHQNILGKMSAGKFESRRHDISGLERAGISLKKGAFALTNVDDKNGVRMLQNTAADRKTYSLQTVADFRSRVVEDTMDGMLIRFDDAQDAFMQFVGRFNAYNLTAIYAAACLLGFPPHDVLVALSALKPVDGRFQTVKLKSGATAIVDYAHTPDALMNVLTTLHEVRKEGQKIICLVGCGGDRDKTKRPEMAHEAVKDADKVILTSDNPRTEDPLDILADMKAGLSPDQLEQTLTIPDRREAIQKAAQIAQKGDIILVAGKGHEDYQEINGVKHHFSDLEELQKL